MSSRSRRQRHGSISSRTRVPRVNSHHTEGPPLDIRKVKKLIELLEESGIAEIEIKEGEEAVRISRMPTGQVMSHYAPTYAPAPVAAAPALAAPAPAVGAAPAPVARGAKEHVVTAPMVGTFYGAAA